MQQLQAIAILIVTAPLLGAVLVGLLGSRLKHIWTNYITCSLVGLSFLLSAYLLFAFSTGQYQATDINAYVWAQTGGINLNIGFMLDKLSLLMVTVVSFVSLMVHIYTIGYMADDPGYQRFFAYISLFTFAMLMLVLANNFLQLFFGWEAVGVMSYLLIGFWFKRPSANFASLKAMLINRLGDFGFILGIAAVLDSFGSLQYSQVFSSLPGFSGNFVAIDLICMCLFIGAMAKSAQIPLHVWLPDSMEGPTPISALIHAATMVTAGVFMVARLSPLFEHSELTLRFITIIGAATAFFIGILAIVQNDIKKIIAYSTISQLGYMVVALGVSAYAASIFHLVTHAFFKALLFLGAGAVIMAMHHEQNIFKMGNLRKQMPVTFYTMLFATLALVGFPGTAGFYSKDLIIELVGNATSPAANIAYYALLSSVFVTALYSFRLLFVVFLGNNAEHNIELPATPKVITIPLILLAIPSVFIGFVMINSIVHGYLNSSLYVMPVHEVLTEFQEIDFHGAWLMLAHGFVSLPFLMAVLGGATAWIFYVRAPDLPQRSQQSLSTLYTILRDKYGFDWVNERLIVPAVRGLADFCWRIIDIRLIDAGIVGSTTNGIDYVALRLKRLNTGYLYHYAFVMITAVFILIFWLFFTP